MLTKPQVNDYVCNPVKKAGPGRTNILPGRLMCTSRVAGGFAYTLLTCGSCRNPQLSGER